MNVVEINPFGGTTLARFFEASLPLTFFTIWIIVAFQSRFVLRQQRDGPGAVWKKLLWPMAFFSFGGTARPGVGGGDATYGSPTGN
jgi:hypothetical protein